MPRLISSKAALYESCLVLRRLFHSAAMVFTQEMVQQVYRDCRDELEAQIYTRVRCRDTAADISQEAFLRLYRIENPGTVDNIKAYLFRIALNLLTDHFRAGNIRGNLPDNADELLVQIEDRRDGEAIALAAEQLELFARALEELPPLSRQIFYLNRFEALKHKEIAERLGISTRTVEDHMHRVMQHCGKRLERF